MKQEEENKKEGKGDELQLIVEKLKSDLEVFSNNYRFMFLHLYYFIAILLLYCIVFYSILFYPILSYPILLYHAPVQAFSCDYSRLVGCVCAGAGGHAADIHHAVGGIRGEGRCALDGGMGGDSVFVCVCTVKRVGIKGRWTMREGRTVREV